MTTTKATAEQRIRQAATDNGWTAKVDPQVGLEFKKGTRYVLVTFDVRGAVNYASTHTGHRITGAGKADCIINILSAARTTRTVRTGA